MPTPLPPVRYRDNSRLAATAVALLCVAFAGDIAVVVMNLHVASVTDAMINRPSTVTSAEIREVDHLRHDVLRWLAPALLVAAAVPFVVWFRRTRLNAASFAPGAMRVAGGWAVGGWVVPVAALWMPWRVAHDIRRGSALPGGRDVLTARLLNSWWALWLGKSLSIVLLPVVLKGILLNGTDRTPLALTGAYGDAVGGVVSGLFGLPAAVAAVLVVRAATRQQRARAAADGLLPASGRAVPA